MYVVLKYCPLGTVPVSLAASLNSSAQDASRWFNASYQAIVTNASGLSGNFKIQASNDGDNWSDIPRYVNSVSANGNYLFRISDIAEHYLRFVWDRTSGTGDLVLVVQSRGW